jgi:hypothetical protein
MQNQPSPPAGTTDRIKKTKYYVRFLNRLAHFEADIELVDVFNSAVEAGKLVPADGRLFLEHVDPIKHPRLAARQGTLHGRMLALAHLKRTLYSSFIKDLYEDVSGYMVALIAGATRAGLSPERLIGEHKVSITVNDVLDCGGWKNVIEMISRDLFRHLEQEAKRHGVLKLLKALSTKLDLGVDENIRDAAIPYLELRHKLVHADGVADEAFCRDYPSLGAEPDKPIPLGFVTITKAREAVVAMVRNYDECAIRKGRIPDEDLQA